MTYGQAITRLLTASLLLVMACQNPEEEGPGGGTTVSTILSGRVLRSDNGTAVPGAYVRDISNASKVDTTDANGTFALSYDLAAGQSYATTIYATRTPGFGNDSASVTLQSGTNQSVDLILVADSTSPPTNPGQTSGQPASVVLVGTEATTISIRGTGYNESSLLTFEVRDSLGNAILGANGPNVKFAIVGGPNGGEYVYPTVAQVVAGTGRISTRLNAGTKPGVIQIQASTRNDSVLSAPARVTIASGLPYGPNASIGRSKANVAGGLFDNERVRITVFLGDRYQNPVPPGTAVYFTTTGGIIQPTAFTDQDGQASVDLITANPRPAGGVAIITARTIGDTAARKADSLIQLQTQVVFSGATIITAPTAAFGVPDSGSYSFAYSVLDANGNPLVAGTTILVTLDGPGAADLEAQGDVDVTMKDSPNPADGNFNVKIVDKTRGGTGGFFAVNIKVKGQNGEAFHTFNGLALTTGGGGGSVSSTSTPRSIALSSISSRTLSVKGTGAGETARLTFIVRDSLGNPVGNPLDPSVKSFVTFSINPSSGLGGAFVYPSGDSTDVNGQVGVNFNSGTQAGVVQVVASTVTAAGTITASPVQITIQGGLPDSNRFVVTLDQTNMPGLVKTGTLGQVAVQAADEFGNAVQPGTAIYFTTNIGLIKASSVTNESGVATAPLSGGVVGASTGQGTVTVQTLGKSGETVQKQLPFLFTGAPVISNVPASGFSIPDSGFYSFSFTVADANGNPLSKGATITVTKDGAGSSDLSLTGDVNRTMIDTRSVAATTFNVTATDKSNGGPSGPVTFTISVSGPNGEATASFTGSQLVTGQPGTGGSGSGFASSIEFLGSQGNVRTLSVRGTGANEAVIVRFVVKDSLGSPVDLNHRATVTLSIQGGPGGGEFLSPTPTSLLTDASGQVYATLNSGTKAGVLQLLATAIVNGRTITSAPIAFTIYGGLPYAGGMTVWTDVSNVPGLVVSGTPLATVNVQLADAYGNPVQPGTSIYFSTTGGLITPSAVTDATGKANATLFGGLPYPVSGIDTVTVTTVGANNATVSKQIALTFSGAPVLTVLNVPTDTLTILDGGYFDLDFRLADAAGNPLAQGNSASVTISSLGNAATSVTLAGDITTTTIDTRLASTTSRRVRLTDAVANGGNYGPFTIRIRSTGPNGTAEKVLGGILGAPSSITPPSATVKNPAQIAFIGVSASDVYVSGVGALENSVITYEVRDSLGNAIEANPRAYVNFSITFFPNTFVPGGTSPVLIPGSDSTDNAGRARVSMSSGTRAGVVQIVASTVVGIKTITSLPVKITIHAGFPDQRHFTMAPDRYNFPGLDKAFVTQKVTVQVADKYSNPVQAGTAVYFYSTHGTMQTGGGSPGLTDLNGFVSQTLYSANPYPEGVDSLAIGKGFTYIYSQTLGESGAQVIDSLEILWTGQPIITRTSGPSSFTIINGGSGGPWTFSVVDRFGHPMSGGTSISVSAGDGTVNGDADATITDTKVGGAGVTDFTITVDDSDPADTDPPANVLLTVVVTHPVYGTYKKIIATGTID